MNCKNCKIDMEARLSSLPSKWRSQIADMLCKYLVCENNGNTCDEFQECETLTTLSDFDVDGTEVCITYKDEHLVEVTRCFDFGDIINNSLNVDPKCITSQGTWDSWTYTQKWQAMIDKLCDLCV